MAKAKNAHTTLVRELLWAADRAHLQHLYDAEKAGNLSPAEERELRELRAAIADVERAFAKVRATKRGGNPIIETVAEGAEAATPMRKKRRGPQWRVIDAAVPELYANGLPPDLTPSKLRHDIIGLQKRKADAARTKPPDPPPGGTRATGG
jgi:hypothetical protein